MKIFQKKGCKITQKPVGTDRNRMKEYIRRSTATIGILSMLFMSNIMLVSASGDQVNIAKGASNIILGNLFWVGLIALAFVVLKCLIARNFVSAVVSGICGGIILVFVQNPEFLSALGTTIWNAVKSQSGI